MVQENLHLLFTDSFFSHKIVSPVTMCYSYLFQLASPVVSAWRIQGSEIQQIDLFSTSSVPALCPESGQPYGENVEVSCNYYFFLGYVCL